MSDYLTTPNSFEYAINRGGFSFRSAQLTELVTAVNNFVTNAFVIGSEARKQQVRDLMIKFQSWKLGHPKEFADRGARLERDFSAELSIAREECGMLDESDDPVGDEQFCAAPDVARNRWREINRHRWQKKVVKFGMQAAGPSIDAGKLASGATVASLVVGGVAAGGVALFAAPAILQVASTGLAIRAAVKTNRHIAFLQKLYDHRGQFATPDHCGEIVPGVPRPDPPLRPQTEQTPTARLGHDMVANHVLPYIIRKKNAKFQRKVVGAIPVISLGETIRSKVKAVYKLARGTKGVHRKVAAQWLAAHFLTCDCHLSQWIIAELYSLQEMGWLLEREYAEVTEFLMDKMQST